jgi:alkaline phosphatase D
MNVQTRRQFVVRAGTVAASAILSPSALAAGLGSARPAALARGGRFSEGVMSGEPTPSAITLWTRLTDTEGKVSVDLEVATDKSFRHVVAHKRLPTSRRQPQRQVADHGPQGPRAVLLPLRDGDQGRPVGRFRTALPADSLQPVRFAFWSCQDYTHGYYNAHEAMAARTSTSSVCLGDYIYDETYHTVKDGTACATTRSAAPSRPRARPASTTSARPRRSTSTATSTRCIAPTSRCARCRRASRP